MYSLSIFKSKFWSRGGWLVPWIVINQGLHLKTGSGAESPALRALYCLAMKLAQLQPNLALGKYDYYAGITASFTLVNQHRKLGKWITIEF